MSEPTASASSPASVSASAPRPPRSPLLGLAPGCRGWSGKEHAALCVTERSSIQGGCEEGMVFLGAQVEALSTLSVPPQCLQAPAATLSAADEERARAHLARGDFAPLPSPLATLEAGARKKVGAVSAALERKKLKHVSIPEAGSWDVFRDRVTVSCGGRQTVALDLEVENPSGAEATIFDVGEGWLLVTYAVSWGVEGDMGSRLDAAVLEPLGAGGCKVHPARAP